MNKRSLTILDLIIILILGLHVFIGLKPGLLYIGGDTGIPLSPIKNLNLFYLWQNQEAGTILLSLGGIFQLVFFAFFKFLGLSLATIQRFYIYFAQVLAGLSMYYLASSFALKRKRIVALVASVFYMFSPWVINYVGVFVFLPYSVMPLILALFIRGISGKMSMLKSVLLIAFSLFGVMVNLPQYSMYFVTVLLMGLYTIFYIFVGKGNLKYSLKYIFFLSFLVVLTSLWLFLPYLSFFSSTGIAGELKTVVSIGRSPRDFGDFGYATILNLLRIFGAAGFMVGGATYSEPYMENPVLIIISYLIPLLAFGAILLKPKSKSVLFFSVVATIFIFLAKGVNAPFGRLHFWLVTYFPLARALRTTWNLSLGANLAYAFLIGATVSEIAERLRRRKPGYFILTIITVVALIFVNAWPLVTGAYFQYKWNPPTFEGVKIPQAYWVLRDYLAKKTTDFRFFRIPVSEGYLVTNWGYLGSNFYSSIFSSSLISGHPPAKEAGGLIKGIYDRIQKQYQLKGNILKALSLLNIKRFVYDGYDKTPKPELKDKISSQLDVSLEKNIDEFSVYQFRKADFLPHFYVPKELIYSNANPYDFAEIIDFPDYDIRSGIYSINLIEKNLEIGSNPKKVIIKAEPAISLKDENKKTQILAGLSFDGIYFPYARWKPGSLFYPLVLKKEELELKGSSRSPENYLNKHLFFASKRISEVKKWGESLTINEWEDVGNYYYQLMKGALELGKLSQQSDDFFFYLLSKTRNVYYAHIEKVDTYLLYNEDSRYFEKENPLDKIFKKLEKDFENLQKLPDVCLVTYQFNIPKEGLYTILIKDENDYLQEIFFSFSKLKINGQEIPRGNFKLENGIIKTIEKMNFKKGNYELELSFSNIENLLSNDSWQKQPLIYEAEDNLLFFHSLKPFSPQQWMFASQEIRNYFSGSFFFISFDYLEKNGRAGFSIFQDGDIDAKTGKAKPLFLSVMPPSKDNVFHHYEGVFKSTNYEKAKIYLLAQQHHVKVSDIRYKNIQVKPVFTPLILLENEDFEAVSLKETPNITFQKINPTKYKVLVEEAKDPYLLIFSEGFHNGWKAYVNHQPSTISRQPNSNIVASYFDGAIKEGAHKNIFLDRSILETWEKNPLPEKRHFLANGYANSWLVKPEDIEGRDTYEIIIEFFPQKMFYLGLGISLLTIILSLGYLFFNKIFKL